MRFYVLRWLVIVILRTLIAQGGLATRGIKFKSYLRYRIFSTVFVAKQAADAVIQNYALYNVVSSSNTMQVVFFSSHRRVFYSTLGFHCACVGQHSAPVQQQSKDEAGERPG